MQLGYRQLQNLLMDAVETTRQAVREEIEAAREEGMQRQRDADDQRCWDEALNRSRSERLQKAGLANASNDRSSDFEEDARSYQDRRPGRSPGPEAVLNYPAVP